jgi:hypothetical protein
LVSYPYHRNASCSVRHGPPWRESYFVAVDLFTLAPLTSVNLSRRDADHAQILQVTTLHFGCAALALANLLVTVSSVDSAPAVVAYLSHHDEVVAEHTHTLRTPNDNP